MSVRFRSAARKSGARSSVSIAGYRDCLSLERHDSSHDHLTQSSGDDVASQAAPSCDRSRLPRRTADRCPSGCGCSRAGPSRMHRSVAAIGAVAGSSWRTSSARTPGTVPVVACGLRRPSFSWARRCSRLVGASWGSMSVGRSCSARACLGLFPWRSRVVCNGGSR